MKTVATIKDWSHDQLVRTVHSLINDVAAIEATANAALLIACEQHNAAICDVCRSKHFYWRNERWPTVEGDTDGLLVAGIAVCNECLPRWHAEQCPDLLEAEHDRIAMTLGRWLAAYDPDLLSPYTQQFKQETTVLHYLQQFVRTIGPHSMIRGQNHEETK